MKPFDLIGETTEYEKKEVLERKKPKSWCKTVSALPTERVDALYLV